MHEADIAAYVKAQIEPFQGPAELGALKVYRCSGRLVDGLFLPCISIMSKSAATELACQIIDSVRSEKIHAELAGYTGPGPLVTYTDVINGLLTKSGRIPAKEIGALEPSAYAIPVKLREQIEMETSLGWTRFQGVMKDGSLHEFGTEWRTEFFQMPEGYSASDLIQVMPVPEESEQHPNVPLFRERPSFHCYVDGL